MLRVKSDFFKKQLKPQNASLDIPDGDGDISYTVVVQSEMDHILNITD
jgi:hypothetical protein